jgi:ABC-type sugar transport system substrate-binding protein
MKKISKVVAVSLVLLLIFSLFACTQNGGSQSNGSQASVEETSGDSTGEGTNENDTNQAKGDPQYYGSDGKMKIAWYFPVPYPYGEAVRVGIEEFAADYPEIDVQLKVGTETTPENERLNVEGLVAQGYKLISMFTADTVSVNTLAEEMESNGVQIGLYGGGATKPTKTKFVVATDLKESAKKSTEWACEKIGGKGGIIIVCGVTGPGVPRTEGWQEAIDEYPDVEVLQVVNPSEGGAAASAEEMAVKIESAMAANIDKLDAIVTIDFNATIALISALRSYRQSGGTRPIATSGIDIDDTITAAINNGELDATLVQNSAAMGYISMVILKYFGEGWTLKPDVYDINSGFAIVTKESINDYQPLLDDVKNEILSSLEETYLVPPTN